MKSARAPLVTLLTDFGTVDPYVGIMKGVILGLAPAATIVDLTHDVPPQDVVTGAFFLDQAASYFPKETVHVAVVDPGVGSSRRAVCIVTGHGTFVGPDNGVLSLAARRGRVRSVVHLDDASWFVARVSRTFHGRDVFAPIAGHLLSGVAPDRLGRRTKRLVRVASPRPRLRKDRIDGEVLFADRFGNLVTNLVVPATREDKRGALVAGSFRAETLQSSYSDVREGALLAIVGSYGFVEICARNGSAADALGMKRGDRVTWERKT